MSKHARQHKVDNTVALFCGGTILERITIMIKVGELGDTIAGFGKDSEAGKALRKVQQFCQIWSIPENYIIRTQKLKPMSKNGTTRGGVPAVEVPKVTKTVMTPVYEPVQTARKGIAVEIIKAFNRRKRAITVTELTGIVGKDASTVLYALNGLVEDKTVRKRKAKKEEKTCRNVKYIYEVAA